MKLYDKSIKNMQDFFEGSAHRDYPYSEGAAWKDNGHSELVMMRDAAFELGGGSKPSVNCTCVTTDEEMIPADEIIVYGNDLNNINGDCSFARLVFLSIEDPGEDEEAYNAIKRLEFVRYNVYPEGYMARVSSESNREQVRVSSEAVSKGISFEKIGCSYIKKYKEVPGVKHVKVIFATEMSDLEPLIKEAKKVDEITGTLTHILDGIPTDCTSCQMKPVCDSVDGLKEMHMRQRKEGGKDYA